MGLVLRTEDVAQALATAFGVEAMPGTKPLAELDFTRTQIIFSLPHSLISVVGIDARWTLTVEFARDDSGEIEAYAAGDVLQRDVVRRIAEANALLDGFLLSGFREFSENSDYDPADRELARTLMNNVMFVTAQPARRLQA